MSAHTDEAELKATCEMMVHYRKRAEELERKVALLEGTVRYLESDREQLEADLARLRRRAG